MQLAGSRAGELAVLLATVPDESGRAAAALPYHGSLLGRLLEQLAGLGIAEAVVVTRERWQADCARAVADAPLPVRIRTSPGLPGDLLEVAAAAVAAGDRLLLGLADLAISGEALGGLLADPRIATGALISDTAPAGTWAAPVRLARGRIVSCGSAFHAVSRPNAALVGIAVIAAEQIGPLARVATELAGLATPPVPPSWAARWAVTQAEAAGPRACVARQAYGDVLALLVVGLVRTNVHVLGQEVRGFFLARPGSVEAAAAAERAARLVDEDRLLLDAAVKSNDGAFTTFLVSPYSRYLARGAARRGWTPNGVTMLSFGVGVLAAGSFAIGNRPGLVLGGILLQVAFTADCVDGQLARYTRTFSSLGAWLDSVLDRAKEYAVYAGLAIGSARGFQDEVWTLAAAALVLQTVRHTVDFCYAGAQHLVLGSTAHRPLSEAVDTPLVVDGEADSEPPPAAPARRVPAAAGRAAIRISTGLEKLSWMRYGKKILVLPIGERFALISLTAALRTPRTTFVALLGWGTLAAGYSLSGKALRSVAQ